MNRKWSFCLTVQRKWTFCGHFIRCAMGLQKHAQESSVILRFLRHLRNPTQAFEMRVMNELVGCWTFRSRVWIRKLLSGCQTPWPLDTIQPYAYHQHVIVKSIAHSEFSLSLVTKHPVLPVCYLWPGVLLRVLLHCAAGRGLLHHQRHQAKLWRVQEHHVRSLPELYGEWREHNSSPCWILFWG